MTIMKVKTVTPYIVSTDIPWPYGALEQVDSSQGRSPFECSTALLLLRGAKECSRRKRLILEEQVLVEGAERAIGVGNRDLKDP